MFKSISNKNIYIIRQLTLNELQSKEGSCQISIS